MSKEVGWNIYVCQTPKPGKIRLHTNAKAKGHDHRPPRRSNLASDRPAAKAAVFRVQRRDRGDAEPGHTRVPKAAVRVHGKGHYLSVALRGQQRRPVPKDPRRNRRRAVPGERGDEQTRALVQARGSGRRYAGDGLQTVRRAAVRLPDRWSRIAVRPVLRGPELPAPGPHWRGPGTGPDQTGQRRRPGVLRRRGREAVLLQQQGSGPAHRGHGPQRQLHPLQPPRRRPRRPEPGLPQSLPGHRQGPAEPEDGAPEARDPAPTREAVPPCVLLLPAPYFPGRNGPRVPD